VGGFRAVWAGVAAATALGVAGSVAGLVTPAYADETVTVQGTAFPDPATAALSFVGCADLYQRTAEPLAPTIGVGPGRAPAGTRSLGWDLAGGNAVGALFPVGSMARTTTVSLAVNSSARAAGVAYAGYQDPADAGTALMWLGRSALVSPGGAWQTIDATTRTYSWSKYDMTTGARFELGVADSATVADFVAAHGGDGPGVYTIGFGCDGTPFSMDRLQVGTPGNVTTYDVEALRTTVGIDSERGRDGEVTITGRLRTLTDDPIPHATMLLERRTPDSRQWKPVLVAQVEDGGVRATVPGDERAFYRWRFVERPLAEGNASAALLLELVSTPPSESPSPSDGPSVSHPTVSPPSATPTSTLTSTPAPVPSATLLPATPDLTPSDLPDDLPDELPGDLPDESASAGESTSHGPR
jgi:hypothetical protein